MPAPRKTHSQAAVRLSRCLPKTSPLAFSSPHRPRHGRIQNSPNPPTTTTPHSNPIGGRVRRKRQRLRSNDSIESDPAKHHLRPSPKLSCRGTPDRDLTLDRINVGILDDAILRSRLFRNPDMYRECLSRSGLQKGAHQRLSSESPFHTTGLNFMAKNLLFSQPLAKRWKHC